MSSSAARRSRSLDPPDRSRGSPRARVDLVVAPEAEAAQDVRRLAQAGVEISYVG
jgi:hypothetical protein